MRNKKIALFWPTLAGGGVERNGLRVAEELIKRGFKVEIVVANAVGELISEVPSGVTFVNLDVPLGRGRLFFAVWPLARYLQRHRPDILWSNMTEANIIAILACMLSRTKSWLIISEHSTLSVRIKHVKRKKTLPLLVRLLYPLANRIHAVSAGVADDLANVSGVLREKIHVIYNPVLTSSFYRKAQESLEHPWFMPGAPPVVLGVGRLVAEKDFSTLIQAFTLVRQKREARLVILGEGEERPKLEKMVRNLGIEKYVDMPGFVENPFKYMKHADVFVLSSVWEGFGNVLVEAMALGTPVISTNCPSGPAEILEGGKWGELVPVGDVESLAKVLLKVLDQKNEAIIKGAIERAKQFSVERIVKKYINELFPSSFNQSDNK